jgi:hypothetical protein
MGAYPVQIKSKSSFGEGLNEAVTRSKNDVVRTGASALLPEIREIAQRNIYPYGQSTTGPNLTRERLRKLV